ncbi:response regulator [Chroococcidiopsis sp. CCALA 051]|uniref:response regulator n=1 Tax=Chroococcidiopsis sp. CCALA 051 TaxID=869949 RepID=UPI000D0CD304|nr:response regulator [Chroococcidiopsis sp. CCALA 051]MBE9014961.1 response regulator [Chroococcidiopsidales cyanobacterium LEGE 13417]PSM47489.1 response regulator [Chroococcidiopsis sp. CCALA 051]
MDLSTRFEKNGTKSILVCDDVYDHALLLQVILEAEGYEVILADSGAAAIAQIERKNPDLVLFDLTMPEIDGIEAVRYMRQNPRSDRIPVILVAPSRRDSISVECQKLVSGIVHKPIEWEELIPQVEAILATPFSTSSQRNSRSFSVICQ